MQLNYPSEAPGALRAMAGLEHYVKAERSLDASLLHLIKIRVSQLNRCAYCIDMHTQDARLDGETEQRLYALSAWRDTPFFQESERAVLAWAEATTRLAQADLGDGLLAELRRHFSDKQIVDLTMAIVAINGWNRLSVGFGAEAGSYTPGQFDGTG
ncbi:carboxymuconolactone decarboxylase family protein [Halomonas sp. THAF12]|uniref:carboxymuconolactone decarboxylase family protein n=1 Tax=Halomonas sp. B23F22_10 TaxID=3459515 RepID=UPI00373F9751